MTLNGPRDSVALPMLSDYLRRIPGSARVSRKLFYFSHNLRDVYDSYLAPSLRPVPTPLGFSFGGSASQHHRAMQAGSFEPAEVQLLSRLIKRADVFIDVGANVGYFTCLARANGKPAIAIEPLPSNLKHIDLNLRANGWEDTEVIPVGVSDHVGLQTLYGASSTGASLIANWAGAPGVFKRTICLSTLDILVGNRFSNQRLLIKVDVEGHEFNVLKGAVGLLARPIKPIWLMESTFSEYHPDAKNPHFGDTFELFWKHGYVVRCVEGEALRVVSRSEVERWLRDGRTNSPYINYLFAPPDAVVD